MTKLTKREIEEVKQRINRDKASGFKFTSLPIELVEKLLAAAQQ